MAREPTVSDARLFRVRGSPQFGVDVVCDRRYDGGCEVAQIKRYRAFGKGDIRAACDLFFEHIVYWRSREVKRFVLMVTEPLQGTGQDEQLREEKRRFVDAGIRFEAWSIYTIVQRLRPWPDIVARVFGHNADYWVQNICGQRIVEYARAASSRARATTNGAAAEAQFAELISLAAAGAAAQLDEIRAISRRGHVTTAISQLSSLQASIVSWERLLVELRARMLRLQATLMIDATDDLSAPKRLLDEADAIDLKPSLRLKAQIVLEEQGPTAAFEFIEGCGSAEDDLTRLAAVCCLRSKDPRSALDRLSHIGERADPETRRLRALALSSMGRSEEAIAEIELAGAAEPGSWAITMTMGMLLYYSALSPIVDADIAVAWSSPCEWVAVKRDDAAVDRIRWAANVFAGLVTDGQERIRRESLEGWNLACLANDAARQPDAEAYCADLLRATPTHPAAITWAIARSYPTIGSNKVLDVPGTRRALEDLLDAGRGGLEHLAALATIMGLLGKTNRVARLITKHAKLFAFQGGAEQRRALLVEIAIRSNEQANLGDIECLDPRRITLLTAAKESDESKAAAVLVDLVYQCRQDGDAPDVLADGLLRLAQLGRLPAVAPYADWLMQAVGTADGFRLAAHARASVRDAAGALAILDAAPSAFPGGRLTRDLEVLRAQCQADLGNLPSAIATMQRLHDGEASVREIVGLADLYARRGDLGAVSRTIAAVATAPDLSTEHALRFAKILSHDDPALARTLWDRVANTDIPAEWLPMMFAVARKLGVGPESAFVVERLVASAVGVGEEAPAGSARALSLEQLPRFLSDRRREMEYLSGVLDRGDATMHLLVPRMGLSFPRLYHADLVLREAGGRDGFLPAVHGGRFAATSSLSPDASAWPLHMDASAVLLAAHLGILDATERCFRPISVSPNLVLALLAMRDRELDGSPEEDRAGEDILEASRSGKLAQTPSGQSGNTGLLHLAASRQGAVVLWDREAMSADENVSFGVNLTGLLERLAADGVLTADRAAKARDELGAVGRDFPLPLDVPAGAPVFFSANTISSAAQAGILGPACDLFEVYADSDWLAHLEAFRSTRASAVELGAWIGAIIDRISSGIDDETYRPLPQALQAPDQEGHTGELMPCLLDLLRAEPQPGNAVWADDRWIGGFPNCDAGALVGIVDMLGALRSYGRLNDAEYYGKLLRLRSAKAVACSRWLRDSLSIECYERLPAMQPDQTGRRVILAGVHVSTLCGWISLFLGSKPNRTRRHDDYMRWLEAESLVMRI